MSRNIICNIKLKGSTNCTIYIYELVVVVVTIMMTTKTTMMIIPRVIVLFNSKLT